MLINHCWCSDSNRGGNYNCRVIVQINRIAEGKTYYNPPTIDWTNLIEKDETFQYQDEAGFTKHGTNRLKPEVIAWLEANIKDRTLKKWQIETYNDSPKGWAIGTDAYNCRNRLSFTLFFERTSDAFKFIKRWSVYHRPIDYLNYFKDIRRKFDFETKTLRRVPL